MKEGREDVGGWLGLPAIPDGGLKRLILATDPQPVANT
ncbi:hypothetical protein J2W63_004582 [Klebsiella sp. 1400]|nr:hypothetical protein [Klebsiella sp. 1400]